MTERQIVAAGVAQSPRKTTRGWLEQVRWVTRRQPLAAAALIVLVLILVVSVFPSLFATEDPLEQHINRALLPPDSAHFFGTDLLGRDIYSRVIYGTGLTMSSGFGVVAIASSIGTILGLLAGARGGVVGGVVMRLADIFLSFPGMIMAMAIIAFFGPTLVNAMLALSLVWWPAYARLVRGQVLSINELPYIEAARSIGASGLRIVGRHILPNCVVPVLVTASLDFGAAVLITASLSFLGVGAQPPSPELGAMVANGRVYLLSAWWYATFPSLVIFVAALALNLVGDGIRDVLDPTLRVS
jgi:peptide/nickel transport system permease protein